MPLTFDFYAFIYILSGIKYDKEVVQCQVVNKSKLVTIIDNTKFSYTIEISDKIQRCIFLENESFDTR